MVQLYQNETLVMILAGGRGERLYPLTRDRAKPSVPFGGIYRIIDFTLSNCLNSGLRRICLLTQYRAISLMQHIAECWQPFFVGGLGEFCLPMPPQQRTIETWYRGTADAIYQNIYTLQQHRPRWVLILSGDHIYKMDYLNMIRFHNEKKAEITIACTPVPIDEAHRFGVVDVDAELRVIGFEEKPIQPKPIPNNPASAFCSMGIYLFNTDVLIRSVVDDAKATDTTHDFGRDVIPKEIKRKRVFAYDFSSEGRPTQPPYWRDIGTIDAYYNANMELLDVEPKFNLYDPNWQIRSHSPISTPAKILSPSMDASAYVENSLIANGCIISGATVRHSILSPGVRVEENALVEDSILFNDVTVSKNASVKRAIIDKHVSVPENFHIGDNIREDRRRFTVTPSGIVVIPRSMHLI